MSLPGRDAYREELTRLAEHDDRIICLEADLGGKDHPFRAAHPDRFVNATDAEKRVAMQWATRANEAYQTLKNPQKRARYLCELNGVDLQRLVRGLNQIGLKPSGIIAILQAIKTAGALQAEVIVQ